MVNHTRTAFVAVTAAVSLASCAGTPAETVCTAVFAYGVVVDVSDSASGAPLAGARGTVRDAGYVDSLRAAGSSTLIAAGERAGTYTVNVVRPGYRSFTRTGVEVTRDACHVQPQRVRAVLASDS